MSETAKASAIRGAKGPNVQVMRSQLGRVRGMGAARSGTAVWWSERLTAVALVPLTLWFVFAALHLCRLPRESVAHWAANPINAALLVALVLTTFRHTQLGVQVVLEDYIHDERQRTLWLVLNKGVSALLGLIALVAVLRLAFTG